MLLSEWQAYLKQTGRYNGMLDGQFGALTKASTLIALTDGPDTQLTIADYQGCADRLGTSIANIQAFATVESSGAGFFDGKPKILPEPHIFSKQTNHIFDKLFGHLSYPIWGTYAYPATQDARYDMILQWIGLLVDHKMPIDAAFASVSWGKFQILGSNFKVCNYSDAILFAEAMARDELTQLKAFENFIRGNGLLPKLRKMSNNAADCTPIALAYNGTAAIKNNYPSKLASSRKAFGGK